MKRRFRIETGRYGGEIVCGTVSKEFVQYWKDKEENSSCLPQHEEEKIMPGTLTPKQKTLPKFLQDKIMKSKKKKRTALYDREKKNGS